MSHTELSLDVPPEPPTLAVHVARADYAAERAAVEARLSLPLWSRFNAFEKELMTLPQREQPLRHIFTPGLYTREIYMFAGTLITSLIHLTHHPFVVSQGVCSVWSEEFGWQLIRAPFTGTTLPGTRRLLIIHEDTIWTTFHVTNETDPEKIMAAITYEHAKINGPIPPGNQLSP